MTTHKLTASIVGVSAIVIAAMQVPPVRLYAEGVPHPWQYLSMTRCLQAERTADGGVNTLSQPEVDICLKKAGYVTGATK